MTRSHKRTRCVIFTIKRSENIFAEIRVRSVREHDLPRDGRVGRLGPGRGGDQVSGDGGDLQTIMSSLQMGPSLRAPGRGLWVHVAVEVHQTRGLLHHVQCGRHGETHPGQAEVARQ